MYIYTCMYINKYLGNKLTLNINKKYIYYNIIKSE